MRISALMLILLISGCTTTSPDVMTEVKRDTVKHLRNQCMYRATDGWKPSPATRLVIYERCHLWAVRTVGL